MESRPIKFREVPKQQVRGRLPDDLEEIIRDRAHKQRRSISSVLTELVCVSLDRDPRDYGIDPILVNQEVG